eukprot:TRINITY_DN89137_c0_g1_i1.p1 TRINITY_DN89137_c0_g1~~TRINITY_DN89137_c0_g1_i1.p1  ORF type:complete len:252 (+),score=45.13 TRINITY_DN89137_c0_g1_i1:83-838(+)
MPSLLGISVMLAAFVMGRVAGDVWKDKYLQDFGSLEQDRQLRTASGKMIAKWLEPNFQGVNMFPKGLTVWNNGYVSPSNQDPADYEARKGGGWSELYTQRAIVGNMTYQLKNITDTSESDYAFVPFATFAASRNPSRATPPDALRAALGMHPNISLKAWRPGCSGSPGYADKCKSILAKAEAHLGRHVKFVQALSVTRGDWVVFPTFLFGQRPDGTLVGVCSTEISTVSQQTQDLKHLANVVTAASKEVIV